GCLQRGQSASAYRQRELHAQRGRLPHAREEESAAARPALFPAIREVSGSSEQVSMTLNLTRSVGWAKSPATLSPRCQPRISDFAHADSAEHARLPTLRASMKTSTYGLREAR